MPAWPWFAGARKVEVTDIPRRIVGLMFISFSGPWARRCHATEVCSSCPVCVNFPASRIAGCQWRKGSRERSYYTSHFTSPRLTSSQLTSFHLKGMLWLVAGMANWVVTVMTSDSNDDDDDYHGDDNK